MHKQSRRSKLWGSDSKRYLRTNCTIQERCSQILCVDEVDWRELLFCFSPRVIPASDTRGPSTGAVPLQVSSCTYSTMKFLLIALWILVSNIS